MSEKSSSQERPQGRIIGRQKQRERPQQTMSEKSSSQERPQGRIIGRQKQRERPQQTMSEKSSLQAHWVKTTARGRKARGIDTDNDSWGRTYWCQRIELKQISRVHGTPPKMREIGELRKRVDWVRECSRPKTRTKTKEEQHWRQCRGTDQRGVKHDRTEMQIRINGIKQRC